MLAIVAIQNVTLDGIIFAGEKLEDFVEAIGLDDFVRDDEIVLGAEVDAILRLFDAADDAAGDTQTPEDQRPLNDLMRSAHDAQLNDRAVERQQREVVGNLDKTSEEDN